MKHNLFALGLISILTGLAGFSSSLAQDSSAPYAVNPLGPSDAATAATAIKSRLEAWGYREVKDLSRDRTGGWHGHVTKDNVEIAVSIDKGGRITAPSANRLLAVRCSQLYGIANRYVSGGAGAEGSLASSMSVIDAGLDCQKGRYDKGIRALEKVLNGQRIAYPPG
jgi:hypothetical protein